MAQKLAPGASISIGVAAHITAASTGDPRFNPGLRSQDRSSAENGIWLCQNCGKLVDSDEVRFPEVLLREWKSWAEVEARRTTRQANFRFGFRYSSGFDTRSVAEGEQLAVRFFVRSSVGLGPPGPHKWRWEHIPPSPGLPNRITSMGWLCYLIIGLALMGRLDNRMPSEGGWLLSTGQGPVRPALS